MNTKSLYTLWGAMFIICAALGFIPRENAAVALIATGLSVAFFVPPALLLYQAGKQQDRDNLKLIRNLSLASLLLTLALLVLNLLSALQSEFLGNVLYGMLIILSTPMVCSGYWVLSLFLWACLLMGSLTLLQKRKLKWR